MKHEKTNDDFHQIGENEVSEITIHQEKKCRKSPNILFSQEANIAKLFSQEIV